MEACPHCTSLMTMCMEELIFNTEILRKSIAYLPSRIHSTLFSEAAFMLPRCGKGVKDSIIVLVSTWPTATFCIKDLLPEKHMQNVLHAGNRPTLISVIVEGLLNLQRSCKLKKIDFTGVFAPSLFELPVLSLSKSKVNSEEVLKEIQKNTCHFLCGEEDENLESVLSWKYTELIESGIPSNFQATGPIEVLAECQINLSDYLAVDNELLGLSVHEQSPFRMRIVRMTVDNYHHSQVKHFKGLFQIIDDNYLNKLVIYGKRRGISLVMWDMAEHLDQLANLKSFGLGTSGPKLHIPSTSEPSLEEIFTRVSITLSKWTQLHEIFFIGIIIGKQMSKILGALPTPLTKLILYGCSLHRDDLVYISASHHVSQLEELGLEYNNLRGLGDIVCDITEKTTNLCVLNLKETKLMLHEKVGILETLQSLKRLHTLVLHENEDMLSTEGYESLVEMACLVEGLREFYIFPFDYKPFDLFYRETVDEMCQDILYVNERTNLDLFY